MSQTMDFDKKIRGRAPQGARGLKLLLQLCFLRSVSRAPQGARGLKYVDFFSFQNLVSRAPQGARGLK